VLDSLACSLRSKKPSEVLAANQEQEEARLDEIVEESRRVAQEF
jgi:hypothetical protein